MPKKREPRERVISARLSETEHGRLSELAQKAGQTLSDYVRDRALGKPVILPLVQPAATITLGSHVGWRTAKGIQYGGTLTLNCGNSTP